MEYRGRITGTARWPPVVAETTWRATVAELADPSRKTTPGPARRHLLTWLARCGMAGAVRDLMAADRRLHREGLLTGLELAGGRRQYQADLAAVGQKIADAGQAGVIAALIADPAAAWTRPGPGKRRTVIGTLMTITIMPAPKGRPPGWRQGQRHVDPRTVLIAWRHDLR